MTMAATELFNRYIWLVDLIYRTGGITREEINRQWAHSRYNVDGEDTIPERTFHRHKDAIKELFDINIVCDRSAGKVYRIENSEDMEHGGVRAWLLNTFAIDHLINESHHLKHRILFEDIPSGQRYLTPLIEAMNESVTVILDYQSFKFDHPFTFEIEPLCVKVFKQRWYVLGRSVADGKIRIYGLDRVHGVETTDNRFRLPKGFDAESYFRDGIGIIIGFSDHEEPQLVEVKVGDYQQEYFRSLPLHHTQKETFSSDDHSIFTFYVRPTFDFVQELLKYGSAVEVIKPIWLRKKIADIASRMVGIYQE